MTDCCYHKTKEIVEFAGSKVMQSTTGLRPIDYINNSGLIKGSEVFWLILQSQIAIKHDYSGFNFYPVILCYMV